MVLFIKMIFYYLKTFRSSSKHSFYYRYVSDLIYTMHNFTWFLFSTCIILLRVEIYRLKRANQKYESSSSAQGKPKMTYLKNENALLRE